MNIREAIYSHLKNNAAVTAIVKTGSIWKICPIPLNQTYTAPYITYQQISEPQGDVSRSRIPRFQISCFSTTAALADTLAETVKTAMKDIAGDYSGVKIGYAQLENKIELYDDTASINYIILDYTILYTEG